MNQLRIKNKLSIALGITGLVIFIAGWYDVLIWMHGRYTSPDSYYSHGFMVPLISGYLIWMNRYRFSGIPVEMSWPGLVVVAFAVGLHLLGTTLYIFSISGFSIFFLVLGTCLFVFGKRITAQIIFPLVFLLFMFPLPMAVISSIAFPMKLFAAKMSASFIGLTGMPVYQEGFTINIPAGTLLVGNPCSGLRSLLSFLMLGGIFAYFGQVPEKVKWLLFVCSIPVALACNILRVVTLAYILHYLGAEAASPDSVLHDMSGIGAFILGMIVFYAIGRLVRWKT